MKPEIASEVINALPQQARDYIAALETECDPQGTIRENFRLREENAGLRAECERLELDARRYRWLRAQGFTLIELDGRLDEYLDDELDRAVDQGLKEQP